MRPQPANLRTRRYLGLVAHPCYRVGGDDADAHGSAAAGAGYDFGDAASMAAEFAPVLGGAPAGQRAR